MMVSVEPVFSKAKQILIEKYNNIILSKYGPNCGVECIDILKKKTIGNRIRRITILTLRRTSGCKSMREIDSASLIEDRRTLDITNGYNLCNDESCTLCDEQSCVKLSTEYQNNRTLYPRGGIWNEGINGHARQVKTNSSVKQLFTCLNPLCKHLYPMTPSKIINEQRGCPYCSRGAKTLCGKNDCIPCTKKSLTSRQNIMEVWSSENTTPPYAIMAWCSQEIWLVCPDCDRPPYLRNIRTINDTCKIICKLCKHNSVIRREIDCIECNLPFMRTAEGQTKCQCCNGVGTPAIPLCSNNDCKKCYDRSFAKRIEEHGIGSLKFREDLNKCTPHNISRQSNQEYMFDCDLCNQLISTRLNKPIIGCTNCSGKFDTENYIRDILSDIHGKPFTKTRSLRWLNDDITGNLMELDGYNEELQIAFEYQGEQHYKLTYYNQHDSVKLLDIQRKDALKKKLCNENRVKLIIVSCYMLLSKYKEYLTAESI
jgi:hypothetical protein